MMLNRVEFTWFVTLIACGFACVYLLFGCQSNELDHRSTAEEENTIDNPNKIMPLGASRVQGFSPWFESYRYRAVERSD